jgi:Resolvase, N terminal domain
MATRQSLGLGLALVANPNDRRRRLVTPDRIYAKVPCDGLSQFLGSGSPRAGPSKNGATPPKFVPQLSSFRRPARGVQDKYRYGDSMDIGYARVSTAKQDLDRQIDALRGEGIPDRHIYVDKKSGSTTNRPGLHEALDQARDGDVIVSTPWTGWVVPSGTP